MNEKFPDKHVDVHKNLKAQMKELVTMSMQSVSRWFNNWEIGTKETECRRKELLFRDFRLRLLH